MELLKIEDHNYSIVYINDNGKYQVYKRLDENQWQIFHRNKWNNVTDPTNLEKVLKNNKNCEAS
jgi:hypothetical protein